MKNIKSSGLLALSVWLSWRQKLKLNKKSAWAEDLDRQSAYALLCFVRFCRRIIKLKGDITPFSTNTSGWDLSVIDNENNVIYTYDNFYDGTIYSYIITVQW